MSDIKQRPTLKTISRLSGLAVPTVSRALNDASDISKKTKKLVKKIADEIGYVPNRAGLRLRTGRTNVISLVLSTEHDTLNHTARLISSVANGINGTHFHLNVMPYSPEMRGVETGYEDDLSPIKYIVRTNAADAIILDQTKPDDIRVKYMMDNGFPFVVHGRTNWSDQHSYVDFDNREFAKIGIKTLTEKGRKNILLISPSKDQHHGIEMREGAINEAKKLGVNLRISDRVQTMDDQVKLLQYVTDILHNNSQYNGFLIGTQQAAMAVVSAIETSNLVLGKDVDVFTKEAMPLLKIIKNKLIVLPEDISKTGQLLAKAVIRLVTERDKPLIQELLIPHVNDVID